MFGERRATAWLVLVFAFALLLQIVELYQFTSFEFDKVNHVIATVSLMQGRGLTIPDTAPSGLPHAIFRPLLGFPPGYALVLAPVQAVTHNFWWSTLIVDVAAQALFLGAWMIALRAAGASTRFTAGVVLLWTILYGPSTTQTYSDLLALALFAGAVAVGALPFGRRQPLAAGLVSGLLMAAACAVRYAYWPLAVVVPAAVLVAWRDRAAAVLAATHAFLAGLAILATAMFMQRVTGEALFLSRWYPEAERGLFWSHLKDLYPFPAQAFGLDRIADRMSSLRPQLAPIASALEWIFALCVAAVALAVLARLVRRALNGSLAPAAVYLQAANVLTCAATLAMILYLTVRLPAVSDGWTVARESRYYMPMLPGIFLWVMSAAARTDESRRSVVAGAAAVITVAVCVTLAFRADREYLYLTKNVHTAWMSAERRHVADVLMSAVQRTTPGEPPVVVDDDKNWRRYTATMAGALVVKRSDVPACGPRTNEPSRYFAVVPRADAAGWQPLLQRRASRAIASVDDADVVVVDGPLCVEPGA